MLARVLKVYGHPVLVTRLNVRQYGHLGLEILMSLARARAEGTQVYFIRPREVVSEALFELDTPEVTIVRNRPDIGAWLRCRWALHDLFGGFAATGSEIAFTARKEVSRQLSWYKAEQASRELRVELLREARRFAPEKQPAGRDDPQASALYYKRRLIRDKVQVSLRPATAARGSKLAADHGIAPDARLVTLHVREAGWKFGREMQDAKPQARDDSVRNARIETYFEAIDFLVSSGYTVVRIGDPTMTPVSRAGVIDLATAPDRSQLLEVYLLMRSEFFLSCEAGPVGVSYLTNTPLLTVNATDPISSYPIRSDGIYILKRVVDRQTDRPLTLREMLTEDHLGSLRNISRFQYIDNTSEEIVAAVREMIALIGGDTHEVESQRMFRDLTVEAGESLRSRLNYVRKWGSDNRFMGDGRIAAFFAERHLDREGGAS